MRFSTRARYGLRLMVELSRMLRDQEIVQLRQIARVTGISSNYLAQLAMPLKQAGLLIGVSGKRGGYQLALPAAEIRVSDVVDAVQGPVGLTDCVDSPEVCLNSSFCEARMIWVIASHKMAEVFRQVTLADMVDSGFRSKMMRQHDDIPLLDPDNFLAADSRVGACPASPEE